MSIDLMEKVITFDGTEALRKDCRFIKGNYYIKDKQCFYIKEKWYRVNSEYIIFDYRKEEYILTSESHNLSEGIVKLNSDNTVVFGHFTRRTDDLFFSYQGELYRLLNSSILTTNSNVREGLNGHYYFNGDSRLSKDFLMKTKPMKEGFYPIRLEYSSDYLLEEFQADFKHLFVGNPLISNAYRYIDDYTFGVEFETERGAIPYRHLKSTGVIPCRDGSISGFEYATIPLQGELGLQALKHACEVLTRYCACSPNESLHIHVGGYPRTIKALASLYRLCTIIQNEVYSMFPYYYVDTAKFKRKSYCGPLPQLSTESTSPKEIFSSLYYHLSGGSSFSRFPTGPHPMDRSGQHKWDVSPRYVWCNMIPLIWSGKKTIEFRCHTPTFNSQKVINWLYIVIAILKYARKHADVLTTKPVKSLADVDLRTILSEAYPNKITSILVKYIDERKIHYMSKNDYIGEGEIAAEMADTNVFTLMPFV